jgi:two-component system, NtrC family, response regulator HydG
MVNERSDNETATAVVMLIDDETALTGRMSKFFNRYGLDVLTVSNGREALDRLDEGWGDRVDVAVLDIKMPRLDGLKTLHTIKRRYPRIEVIIFSAHRTVDGVIEGLKINGAFDFLMKPLPPEILLGKVVEAIARKRSLEPSRSLREFSNG